MCVDSKSTAAKRDKTALTAVNTIKFKNVSKVAFSMEYICLIKKENARKAEEAIRKDFDVAARQSVAMKDLAALGLKGEGTVFYITGTDEGVAKCKELIKEFVIESDAKVLEQAKQKIKEESDKAAEGMGGIFN